MVKQKDEIRQKEAEIICLARELCLKMINEEYADLAEKMIRKLGRKREVPFVRGKSEIWATAVVQSIGTINFLYDKSFLPYQSLDALCGYYKLNKSTVTGKSGQIQKMLGIRHFDEEFSTAYLLEENPYKRLRATDDGFLYFDENEEDGEDISVDTGPIETGTWIDKVALFVLPKQPFIDWISSLIPDGIFLSDDFEDGNTYLFSGEEYDIIDEESLEMLLEDQYEDIFRNELTEWSSEPSLWPKKISLSMFKEWFSYHFSGVVFDLSEE
jgi:hypothetical protein